MARLLTAGAEIDGGLGTASQNTGPDGQPLTLPFLRDTSVFRSGTASWKFDSGVGNAVPVVTILPVAIAVDGRDYFLRIYVMAASAPTTTALFIAYDKLQAWFRTDGAVELRFNGSSTGVTGSPSAAIADGAWHRIEVNGVATATSLWTGAELQVDGVSVQTWSGSVNHGTPTRWSMGWITAPGANTVINIDDLALNDSTGSVNNTWCGDGKVVLLLPISDNAAGTGWVEGGGGTGNLFDAVNNTPPVGVADTGTNTSQIRNATSAATSSYDANLTSYATAGIAAGATINAVQNWVATAAPVTTSAKQGLVGNASNPAIATVALNATGTAGAFWAGLAGGTFGAGWKWSAGTMTEQPSVTLGTSPVMRVTQVTSSTRVAMVCFMGMYVDYTPAVVAAGIPDVGMALTVT